MVDWKSGIAIVSDCMADQTVRKNLEAGVRRGRVPWPHPARHAAHGRAQSGAGRDLTNSGDEDDRAQDRLGVPALRHRQRW